MLASCACAGIAGHGLTLCACASCKTQLLDYYGFRSAVLGAGCEQNSCERNACAHERLLQLQIDRLTLASSTTRADDDERAKAVVRLTSESELYPASPMQHTLLPVDAAEAGDEPQEADEDADFWNIDLVGGSEDEDDREAMLISVTPEPTRLQASTAASSTEAYPTVTSPSRGIRRPIQHKGIRSRLKVLQHKKEELEAERDRLMMQEEEERCRLTRLHLDEALSSVTAEALLNYGRYLLANFCFEQAVVTAQQSFSILSKEIQSTDDRGTIIPVSPFGRPEPIRFFDGLSAQPNPRKYQIMRIVSAAFPPNGGGPPGGDAGRAGVAAGAPAANPPKHAA